MSFHGFVALFFIVWMYHSLFIHSPIEGHLSCFQVLAIMNKAALNIHVQVLYGPKFSDHLGIHHGLLNHLVRVCLICKKLPNCFPKWQYHSAFPPAMNESSCCSTSSPSFDGVSVFDFHHSNRCVVVSHIILTCNSLIMYDLEHLLICLFLIYMSSLLWCLSSLWPIF